MRAVRPLYPHIDQSLDGAAAGRVTFGHFSSTEAILKGGYQLRAIF